MSDRADITCPDAGGSRVLAGMDSEVQWGFRWGHGDTQEDSFPPHLDEHGARRLAAKDARRVVRRTVYYGPAEEVS